MQEYYLRNHEITKEAVSKLLRDLYYRIADLLISENITAEQKEKLDMALCTELNGELGVAPLMMQINRSGFDAANDPEVIYIRINNLIQEINHVLSIGIKY